MSDTISDESIRKAVEADIQQYLTDSLTPDRGYATPIDNVKALAQRALDATRREALLTFGNELQSVEKALTEKEAEKCEADAEIARLKAQINDMCHDKHVTGPVTAEEFCTGCEHFQISLFGHSPIAALRAEIAVLKEERDAAIVARNFVKGHEGPTLRAAIDSEPEQTKR